MKDHYITELSDEKIGRLSDDQLRDLVRNVDLPLKELGRVAERLEQLDRRTLVRLVYQIRRQYQQRKINQKGQTNTAPPAPNASEADDLVAEV